ncbi:putative nicotinate-nucleotide adenylyltransferase [Bacteroidia bacterium]|nr:putative nicotinate-nucleotide adenylyltransferase [Bacteroidia bacterium]GHT64514.1 putative nicotinate-nucleotide adenylyltransferase [Bacteroidia bacterium]
MKIGIFPGSFNPVHIGHLAIANYVAEFGEFDEIWFLITPKNPLKPVADLMDQELRLELIEKAIGDYPKFKTCTIEWDMPQPTYTINTLQKLRMLFPEHSFELIIGSDNWETIHRWKDYQLILKNFRTLIYPRLGTGKIFINHPNAKMIKGAPKIEISSSVIRNAIKQGKDVRFYMPAGIYEDLIAGDFFKKEEPVAETPEKSTEKGVDENIEK